MVSGRLEKLKSLDTPIEGDTTWRVKPEGWLAVVAAGACEGSGASAASAMVIGEVVAIWLIVERREEALEVVKKASQQ